MKKALFFVFLTIILCNLSFAKKKQFKLDIVDEEKIQTVIELKKDKATIHENTLKWIADEFKDNKCEIIENSEDKITGIGKMVTKYYGGSLSIFIDYIIDIKDNRIRLTFSNFHYIVPDGSGELYLSGNSQLKQVRKSLVKKVEKLIDTINGKEEDDEW